MCNCKENKSYECQCEQNASINKYLSGAVTITLKKNVDWLACSTGGKNLWYFLDKKWCKVTYPYFATSFTDLAYGKYAGKNYFFVVGGYDLGRSFAILAVTPKLEVTDISNSLPQTLIPLGKTTLTSIAYDKKSDTWATVGDYPVIYWTKGCNWKCRLLTEYFSMLSVVASDGNNNWVVGGVANNFGSTIYFQKKGLDGLWTDTNVTDRMYYGGIASNGCDFVAASAEGTIWYTCDGNLKKWKKGCVPLKNIYFTKVIWNGCKWIASWSKKDNSRLGTLYSKNGEDWKEGINDHREHKAGLITMGTNYDKYAFSYVTPECLTELRFCDSVKCDGEKKYIIEDQIAAVAAAKILP